MKKTVVLGANTNPDKFAYKAMVKLNHYGHEVVGVGLRPGKVKGMPIYTGFPEIKDVDTITLYVSGKNQPPFYDYLIGLAPKRIIFNPGTENSELVALAEQNGIEPVEGCTLVMLSLGVY